MVKRDINIPGGWWIVPVILGGSAIWYGVYVLGAAVIRWWLS